jgi:hypothetical protein
MREARQGRNARRLAAALLKLGHQLAGDVRAIGQLLLRQPPKASQPP